MGTWREKSWPVLQTKVENPTFKVENNFFPIKITL